MIGKMNWTDELVNNTVYLPPVCPISADEIPNMKCLAKLVLEEL